MRLSPHYAQAFVTQFIQLRRSCLAVRRTFPFFPPFGLVFKVDTFSIRICVKLRHAVSNNWCVTASLQGAVARCKFVIPIADTCPVTLSDPVAVFLGMSALGPFPQLPTNIIVDFIVCLLRIDTHMVIAPACDPWVQCFDELLLRCRSQLMEDLADTVLEFLYRLLGRFYNELVCDLRSHLISIIAK